MTVDTYVRKYGNILHNGFKVIIKERITGLKIRPKIGSMKYEIHEHLGLFKDPLIASVERKRTGVLTFTFHKTNFYKLAILLKRKGKNISPSILTKQLLEYFREILLSASGAGQSVAGKTP